MYFILVLTHYNIINATFGTNFELCRCFISVTNKLKEIMLTDAWFTVNYLEVVKSKKKKKG